MTVRMQRGNVFADVHPDEVDNWKRCDWKVAEPVGAGGPASSHAADNPAPAGEALPPIENASLEGEITVDYLLRDSVDDRSIPSLIDAGILTGEQFLAADDDQLAAMPWLTYRSIAKSKAKIRDMI